MSETPLLVCDILPPYYFLVDGYIEWNTVSHIWYIKSSWEMLHLLRKRKRKKKKETETYVKLKKNNNNNKVYWKLENN